MSVTSLPNLPPLESGQAINNADGKHSTPERIKALAAQFESMLVSQMMQQMRASMFDSDEGDGGNSSAPLADALFSELSLALSRAGGLGLSQALVAPLMRQTGGVSESSHAPASIGAVAPETVVPFQDPSDSAAPAPFVTGRMSSAYGWRRDPIDNSTKFHKGVDIAMPVGSDLPAAQAGTVKFAGEAAGYGLTVVIDHGSFSTRYAHLSKLDVKSGDAVQAGQVIGQSGATGRVTGAHLHFEVLEKGQSVNPAEILQTYMAGESQDRH